MTQQTAKPARWVCLECHYIYDPAKGDKTQGIPRECCSRICRKRGAARNARFLNARKACLKDSMTNAARSIRPHFSYLFMQYTCGVR